MMKLCLMCIKFFNSIYTAKKNYLPVWNFFLWQGSSNLLFFFVFYSRFFRKHTYFPRRRRKR